MKKRIHVVIGANYGDEGKGITVDRIARENDLVIRFNGGAQAGHTVETRAGFRHVFKHFGSGTRRNARTYLAKEFIVNPMMFQQEHQVLDELGLHPRICADPRCRVTTFYDILLNHFLEELRGAGKHGSCGVGIATTIVRSNRISLEYKDLFGPKEQILHTLRAIERYTREALWYEAVGTGDRGHGISNKYIDLLANVRDNCDEMFLAAVDYTTGVMCQAPLNRVLDITGDIVFEGAQGLGLDMANVAEMPHLTPSHTGLRNVHDLWEENNLGAFAKQLSVHYITRSYLTRHGATKFFREDLKEEVTPDVDKTNCPNEYQGSLKYQFLHLDELYRRVKNDLEPVLNKHWFSSTNVKVHLDIGHLNQEIFYVRRDQDDVSGGLVCPFMNGVCLRNELHYRFSRLPMFKSVIPFEQYNE